MVNVIKWKKNLYCDVDRFLYFYIIHFRYWAEYLFLLALNYIPNEK